VSVVIKVLFLVLILSTAAVIAVGLAIHFRVKRHLDGATPEPEIPAATTDVSGQDDRAAHTERASQEDDHGESSDSDT
jgi:hypothetical protein